MKFYVIAHTNLLNVSDCLNIGSMKYTVMTYETALETAGSEYMLVKLIDSGELCKIDRGVYSTREHPDPLVLAGVLYPNAIVTMDSALYAHGLTDTIPDKVHLATSRRGTRINRAGYRQYFTDDELLEPGVISMMREDGVARIYSLERMLVEVMRRQASLPLDFYKEIIGRYRKIIDDIDIRKVEDYISMFKRSDFMFDILQREVL